MTNSSSNDISAKLKGLGMYQIAGGFLGIGITGWFFAGLPAIPGILLLMGLIPIGLYVFSIYCGIVLLNNHPNGLNLSAINQYVQLINFSVLGFAFTYIAGVYCTIGIDLTYSVIFKFNIGISTWQIHFNTDKQLGQVNVNLVAVFIIVFIDKLKKKTAEDEFELDIAKQKKL